MIEWIIPNAQKNSMEPVRLTLKPGGSSDTHLPHAGEEFGYVLKGTVRVFTVEELILSGQANLSISRRGKNIGWKITATVMPS